MISTEPTANPLWRRFWEMIMALAREDELREKARSDRAALSEKPEERAGA